MGHTHKAVTAPIRAKQSSSMGSRMGQTGSMGYQEWKGSGVVRQTVEAFAQAAIDASRSAPRGARPWWVPDLESQVVRALASGRPVNLQVVSVLLVVAAQVGGDVDGAMQRCAAKLAVVLELEGPDDPEEYPLIDALLAEADSDRAEDAIQDRLHTYDHSPTSLGAWYNLAADNIAAKQRVMKLIDRIRYRESR